jgi:hypothetical protein
MAGSYRTNRPHLPDDLVSIRGLEAIEHARHAEAWQGSVDFDDDTLAREIVDDVQRAKGAAIRERVERKVHRPTFAAPRRGRQRDPLAARQPLALPSAHLQAGRR